MNGWVGLPRQGLFQRTPGALSEIYYVLALIGAALWTESRKLAAFEPTVSN